MSCLSNYDYELLGGQDFIFYIPLVYLLWSNYSTIYVPNQHLFSVYLTLFSALYLDYLIQSFQQLNHVDTAIISLYR